MKEFEAYIHSNGELKVKQIVPFIGPSVNTYSPFVKKYLGVKVAETIEEAKEKFKKI